MVRLSSVKVQSVGMRNDEMFDFLTPKVAARPRDDRFEESSLSASIRKKIASKKLRRVAGNYFICESPVEFWKVINGKLIRVSGAEVDNGETMAGPMDGNPGGFVAGVLSDLTL